MELVEGKQLLINRVEYEIGKSGWWIFNKRNIELSITRILKPYEKTANLPLPDKLNVQSLIIDKQGVWCQGDMILWTEICATGIKTETIYDRTAEMNIYLNHLLVCLNNGTLMQFSLGDISHLKGLLGHFIELYKLQEE
jgi:hypothetical protein